MKRNELIMILIFLFGLFLVKMFIPHNTETILGDKVIIGDVNNDGQVSSIDYIMIKKHILGLTKLDNQQSTRADVNGDGKISSLDYIMIKKIIIDGENTGTKPTTAPTPTNTPKPTATPTPTPKPTNTSKPTATPTPTPKPTVEVSIKLNTSSATITYPTAKSFTITSTGDGKITCSSSDEQVATCSISGNTLTVTPKAKNADNQKATITVTKSNKNAKLSIVVNREELKCPGTATSKVNYNGKEQSYSGNNCPSGSTRGTAKGTKVGTYTANCTANAGYKFASTCTNAKLVINEVTYSCKISYDKMSNELKITGSASDGTKVTKVIINNVTSDSYIPTADGVYNGTVYFANGKTCSDGINVKRLRILFIGDSITAGINDTGESWYSWADYIGDRYKFYVRKAGYPGYLISDYFYTRYNEARWIIWYVWKDSNVPGGTNMGNYVKGQITGGYNSNGTAKIQYDYVILHGGINDINMNTPLGTSDYNDKSGNYQFDTFLGGLDRYVYLAKQYWPKAKIGYIVNFQTPNHPDHKNDEVAFSSKTQKYFNAMKNTLNKKWNIPYLDLYNGKASNRQSYSSIIEPYLYDGLHPNKEGHKKLGSYVYDWLKTF